MTFDKFKEELKQITKPIAYLKARLSEHMTYAAIGVAITGGAALSKPYSYLFIAVGVIGALIPTPNKE